MTLTIQDIENMPLTTEQKIDAIAALGKTTTQLINSVTTNVERMTDPYNMSVPFGLSPTMKKACKALWLDIFVRMCKIGHKVLLREPIALLFNDFDGFTRIDAIEQNGVVVLCDPNNVEMCVELDKIRYTYLFDIADALRTGRYKVVDKTLRPTLGQIK